MSDAQVVAAAANLKRTAPVEYEEFVKRMREHAERAKNDLLAAEPASIFFAQGRAQCLAELAKKLENCIALESPVRRT